MSRGDIFDVLSRIDEDAIPATDRLMWELLTANGYDVRKLAEAPTERRVRALLVDEAWIDRENGAILFRYVLLRRGREIAKSAAIKFVAAKKEE